MNTIKQLIDKYCPDGVEYKKLGEIGSFYSGLSGKSKDDFKDGNAMFITYMNVYSNPSTNLDVIERVKIGQGEKQNKIEKGDILFTGSSETPDECGMSSVVTDDITSEYYLNSFCFGFRLNNKDTFEPNFLKHLFRDRKMRAQIARTANGVTRYNVSKKLFARIIIPVPPLPVQREIVRILDSFTSLEAELEAELEARRKQYEYYRDQLLSFKHLSGGGRNEVEWKTLGEIGEVCMCKRIMKNQTNAEGCIPFYKIGTFGKKADAFISEELYEEYKQKYSFPRKGEVLISAAGTIGRAVIYDGEPAYFQDSNIVWIANDESLVLNKYLYYFYSVADWRLEGGTIKRLYNNNLKAVKIPLPSLSTQRRIVSILDRFESLVNDITTGLPAEIAARHQQYEYYRDQLLSFKRKS
jgi:type I restriction enzyme S subunit